MLKYYRVVNTDLYLKGKLIPENSSIEITEKEAEELSEYLMPINTVEQKEAQSSTTGTKKQTKKPGKKDTIL